MAALSSSSSVISCLTFLFLAFLASFLALDLTYPIVWSLSAKRPE